MSATSNWEWRLKNSTRDRSDVDGTYILPGWLCRRYWPWCNAYCTEEGPGPGWENTHTHTHNKIPYYNILLKHVRLRNFAVSLHADVLQLLIFWFQRRKHFWVINHVHTTLVNGPVHIKKQRIFCLCFILVASKQMCQQVLLSAFV